MGLVHVSDKNFKEEILKSTLPCLVDFHASWCGPCKMIAPTIEKLSKKYDGRVKFAKVDVDEAQDTATQFGIMSVPTIILFQNGKVQDQIVGAVSEDVLKKKIDENLG